MTQGRPKRRRIDADGAWKRVLSDLLEEFVAFALPDLHGAVDWLHAPIFLEQELRPISRRAAAGRRVADVVVQLWLRDGKTTWLIVHVEVQTRVEDDFGERMYNYAALLHQRFRRSAEEGSGPPVGIVGVAILADSSPSWRPGEYHWGWGDFGVRYRYRAIKLADWKSRSDEIDDDPRLFAWVIRVWLLVQQAGRAIDAQAQVRRSVGRQLVAARRQALLSPAQALGIYTFLDTTGGLPDTLAEMIDQEVQLVACQEGCVG